MQAVFTRILNMSITGSIVIAVVLLARLFLKRAPKIYSYALWAVVLFRLLCPLSVTAGLSVLKPLPVTTTPGISAVSYQPVAQAVKYNRTAMEVWLWTTKMKFSKSAITLRKHRTGMPMKTLVPSI